MKSLDSVPAIRSAACLVPAAATSGLARGLLFKLGPTDSQPAAQAQIPATKKTNGVPMKQKTTILTLLLFLVLAATSASAFYDPGTQRWLTRDPIGEQSGYNLYCFLRNSPDMSVDPSGLTLYKCSRQAHFPAPGAQHVYIWDSNSKKGCGQGGGFKKQRGVDNPEDRGPGTPGHTCVPIPNSEGKEQATLDCCFSKTTKSYGKGMLCPGEDGNDCHSFLADCLARNGLDNPSIYGRFKTANDFIQERVQKFCQAVRLPHPPVNW